MAEFKFVARDYTPSIDLNVLGNTYNTLEKGHQEAVKAASDLEVAMANLDLNEAESEWRQQKINEIKNTIAANTVYGNSYAALDDLVMKAGDLRSDQGMIGRLQAQQDYKAFKTRVENDNTLPQDYKDYFLAHNPYYYKDTVDKNGNIIGGTKWQAGVQPTQVVPLNKILDNALQWAAKESGSGTATRWMDANGNLTNDPTMSATGEYFDIKKGSWERLSKEKLAAAVEASIDSIPGARQSLQQDYDIAKWNYEQGKPSDITGKDGVVLPPEQYLAKRIDPFFDAATYYNYNSSVQYGNAMKAQIALRTATANAGSGAQQQSFDRLKDNLTVKSNLQEFNNNSAIEAQGAITKSNQQLSDWLGADVTKLSDSDILNRINSIQDPSIRMQARQALDTKNENQSYINGLLADRPIEEQNKFNAYNMITSLSVGDESNPAYKQYADLASKLFNGKQEISQQMYNANDIEKFYDFIGGRKAAQDLGIQERVVNGNTYMVLPFNKKEALYSFAKAGKAVAMDVNPVAMFLGMGKTANQRTAFNGNDNAMTVYNRLLNYVDNLGKSHDNIISNKTVLIEAPTIAAVTPEAAEIQMRIKSGEGNRADNKAALDVMNDEAANAIKSIDLVQTGAYRVGNSNTFERIDSEERAKLTQRLKNAKKSDITQSSRQDPETGEFGMQIDIAADENNDAVTFFVPSNGVDNSVYQEWNRNTSFRANNDVNKYFATGQPLTVMTANIFNIDNNVSITPIEGKYVVSGLPDNKTVNVTKEEARKLRDAYLIWQDTYNIVASSSNYNANAVVSTAELVATTFANILYNGNGDIAVDYYTRLLSSIGR